MAKLLTLAALVFLAVAWWRGRTQRLARMMPLAEARALLGLGQRTDAEAVRAAHRRIIARVHPDAGGTPELARRANLARDVLLAELGSARND